MQEKFMAVAAEWVASLDMPCADSPAEDLLAMAEASALDAVRRFGQSYGFSTDEDSDEDRLDAQINLCRELADYVASDLAGEMNAIFDDVNGHFGLETGPAIWVRDAAEFYIENMAEVDDILDEFGITGAISDQLIAGAFLAMCRRAEIDVREALESIDEGELSDMFFSRIFKGGGH